MEESLLEKSKYLSYILRHKPESIGIQLTDDGWASIDRLCSLTNKAEENITKDDVLTLANMPDNGRFELSGDRQFVRAIFGHSVAGVEIPRIPTLPPEFLYHGTAVRFLSLILDEGLSPGERHYVHLGSDAATAFAKGKRYGKPVLLRIKSFEMWNAGYAFYRVNNGLWLVEIVPISFLEVMSNF